MIEAKKNGCHLTFQVLSTMAKETYSMPEENMPVSLHSGSSLTTSYWYSPIVHS